MKFSLSHITRGSSKIRKTAGNLWTAIRSEAIDSAFSLSEIEFMACFDMEDISGGLGQGNLTAAKAVLLKYYGHRVSENWPAPPNTITDLRLRIDELSPQQILARANRILDFHLFSDNPLPVITSDGKIDWFSNPISSPEWLWRLHRHQWWPVLGLAYKLSGDEIYAQAFVSQILNWIASNPLPPWKNEQSHAWRLMEAGLRLRVSWIPSFALFYHSQHFSDEAKLTMLRSIYDHARFLYYFKTNRNHLLRESNGLAYVGVYFSEFRNSNIWLQEALKRIDREIRNQVNQDGSHIEMSTGYQWLVVDELENTLDLLRTNQLALPNEDLQKWLEKMYILLANLMRPDGSFPEINDGFIRWKRSRLAEAGKKLGREDLIYIGTAGKSGKTPQNTSIGFHNAGLFVMRNDWTKNGRYLIFDAGPYGGPHGHEDKLSIEIAAFGQSFIVDSGSYTYEKTDLYRIYFVGSQAHNTILVDGFSQIRRWQKKHMYPEPGTDGESVWISNKGFDYAASSYGEGYSSFSLKKPKNPDIIEDVSHTRQVVFVKPDYWVIIDTLKAKTPHYYQLLFHVPPDVEARPDPELKVQLCGTSSEACLYIVPSEPGDLSLRLESGNESPIQGWFSQDHHYKVPSTTVIYDSIKISSVDIATLLYPVASSSSKLDISIRPIEVSGNQNLAYAITTPAGIDYIMCSGNHFPKQFASFESAAKVAVFRTDLKGKVTSHTEGG